VIVIDLEDNPLQHPLLRWGEGLEVTNVIHVYSPGKLGPDTTGLYFKFDKIYDSFDASNRHNLV
jgi:hypothetical protein